jgi:hypothetical protein
MEMQNIISILERLHGMKKYKRSWKIMELYKWTYKNYLSGAWFQQIVLTILLTSFF